MIVYLLIILNLFVLESILSIDNAAVLSLMVKHLPENQQKKALRYGIIGAFAFRGICLFIASWIIKFTFLKILGGIYLLYLAYGHFSKDVTTIEEQKASWFKSFIGTIFMVELMDIAFSIDNIFAAVAMTDNIYLILLGVFMGIVAMRFVAGWFLVLIAKYPSLENSAFKVIALLGTKLVFFTVFEIESNFILDLLISTAMMVIFFIPLLDKKKDKDKHIKNLTW